VFYLFIKVLLTEVAPSSKNHVTVSAFCVVSKRNAKQRSRVSLYSR